MDGVAVTAYVFPSFPQVVMGIKDPEKDEDCASQSGHVQANYGPMLPPVHPGQPGECEERQGKGTCCMLTPSSNLMALI